MIYKECDVSTEELQKGFPEDDGETLILKILEEVRSIQDPATLNVCRSLFRSKVPFHLRSYVAAALILKTLGVRAEPPQPQEAPQRGVPHGFPSRKKSQTPDGAAKQDRGVKKEKPAAGKSGPEEQRLRKGKFSGEGTTLFFSMGRRQRFMAQNILRVLSGISGIEESDIGMIRTFDNYSFVSVHPAAADLIIQDVDGTLYKGRKLVVNRARARNKDDPKSGKAENRGEPHDPSVDEGCSGEGIEKEGAIE